MIKPIFKILCISAIICLYSYNYVYADNFSNAENLLRKASITSNQNESYEYIINARKLYEEEYEQNAYNIKALLGLSKTYQLTQNRPEAKLYVLKAYNFKPYDANLQKEMGDFFFNFQEYDTALEYYKLALSSGLLMDYNTNLQTAKCYEKLGDNDNAELYYKICKHVNPTAREALNKVNEYESSHHPDDTEELENAKYKYLFKNKKIPEAEQIEKDTNDIIETINSYYL